LLTHEIVDKALLDELRLHYLHAHQIATRAERDAVKPAGVSWLAYQLFMKKHEKQIEEEKLVRVPQTLDLTPSSTAQSPSGQDASKVPGLPGSKSGPAVRPPASTSK
jgi:hypothetical protein